MIDLEVLTTEQAERSLQNQRKLNQTHSDWVLGWAKELARVRAEVDDTPDAKINAVVDVYNLAVAEGNPMPYDSIKPLAELAEAYELLGVRQLTAFLHQGVKIAVLRAGLPLGREKLIEVVETEPSMSAERMRLYVEKAKTGTKRSVDELEEAKAKAREQARERWRRTQEEKERREREERGFIIIDPPVDVPAPDGPIHDPAPDGPIHEDQTLRRLQGVFQAMETVIHEVRNRGGLSDDEIAQVGDQAMRVAAGIYEIVPPVRLRPVA